MKILFLSTAGSLTSIAFKLQDAGHTVYFWDPGKGNTGKGILKNEITDWKPYLHKVDLIVCDNADFPDMAAVRKSKTPYVMGNELLSRVENDRLFGKFIFQRLGMTTSDCVHFNDFKKAMEFVKKNSGRWVFKANGQASRTLGFVAKEESGKDMLERLAFYESHMKNNKHLWDKKLGVDFVLERAVDGIEVACGGYWDGEDFCGLNINWEHKRLGVGNVGVATGEMGTVVHGIGPDSKLYHDTLGKLKILLKSAPYRTYVDLNCIVNQDNAYILEITSRTGYPMEALMDSVAVLPTAERYMALAKGTLHKEKFFKHPWGIAVVGGTFGLPFEIAYDEYGANQPFDFDKKDIKNLYLDDVYRMKDHYMTAEGGEGWIFTATANDVTLEGARAKAFEIVDRVSLPGLYYRKDIGEKVKEQVSQLKQWGWI